MWSLRPPVETIGGCAKRVPRNTTPGHHCEDGMGTKNLPPPEGTEVMAEAVHTGRVAVEFDRTDYIPRRRGQTLSLGHGRSRRPVVARVVERPCLGGGRESCRRLLHCHSRVVEITASHSSFPVLDA